MDNKPWVKVISANCKPGKLEVVEAYVNRALAKGYDKNLLRKLEKDIHRKFNLKITFKYPELPKKELAQSEYEPKLEIL